MRDALYFVRRWHKINMRGIQQCMVRIRRAAHSQVAVTGVMTRGCCVPDPGKSREKGGV